MINRGITPSLSIILLIFSYALFSPVLPHFEGFSKQISFYFRVLFLMPCLAFILRDGLKVNLISSIWMIFLTLIGIQLFYESFILSIIETEFFYKFVIGIYVPSILISIINIKSPSLNLENYSNLFLIILFLHIINAILFISENPVSFALSRFGYPSFNPNSLSIFALVTFIILSSKNSSILFRIFSLIIVLISNSRQASLGLIFFVLSKTSAIFKNPKSLFIFILVSLLYFLYISNSEYNVLGRLIAIFSSTEQSVTVRLEGYLDGLESISKYPFFGKYLSNGNGGFLHNIVLEIMQGFGIFFAFAFFVILLSSILSIYKNSDIEFFVIMTYFISSLFSGALYSNSELILLISYGLKKIK